MSVFRAIAALCVVLALTIVSPGTAVAAPGSTGNTQRELHLQGQALDATIERYHTAQAALAKSQHRLSQLNHGLAGLRTQAAQAQGQVGQIAATLYESPFSGLVPLFLPAGQRSDVLSALTTLSELTHQRRARLESFTAAQD